MVSLTERPTAARCARCVTGVPHGGAPDEVSPVVAGQAVHRLLAQDLGGLAKVPVTGGTWCQCHRAEHLSQLGPWGALAQCRLGSLPITSVCPLLTVPWRRPESGSAAEGQAEESPAGSQQSRASRWPRKGCDAERARHGLGSRSSCGVHDSSAAITTKLSYNLVPKVSN